MLKQAAGMMNMSGHAPSAIWNFPRIEHIHICSAEFLTTAQRRT
jgi:hypothetical protein